MFSLFPLDIHMPLTYIMNICRIFYVNLFVEEYCTMSMTNYFFTSESITKAIRIRLLIDL